MPPNFWFCFVLFRYLEKELAECKRALEAKERELELNVKR